MKKFFLALFYLLGFGTYITISETTTIFAQTLISSQEARNIALEHVSGTILRTEFDYEDGINYFEVYISTENGIAEVYINAKTGDLIEIDWESEYLNVIPTENTAIEETNVQETISFTEANEIALTHIPGHVLHTDFESSRGLGLFNVYVWSGLNLVEITIDRETGQLLDIDTYPVIILTAGSLFILGSTGFFVYRQVKKSKVVA